MEGPRRLGLTGKVKASSHTTDHIAPMGASPPNFPGQDQAPCGAFFYAELLYTAPASPAQQSQPEQYGRSKHSSRPTLSPATPAAERTNGLLCEDAALQGPNESRPLYGRPEFDERFAGQNRVRPVFQGVTASVKGKPIALHTVRVQGCVQSKRSTIERGNR